MKSYQFQTNNYFIGERTAIREKYDIIILLINSIKYICSAPLNELVSVPNDDITLVIHVDKMSRIFFCQEEKIHTFQFPFLISEEDGMLNVYYKDYELDSKITTILLSLFKASNQLNKSLESMFDLFYGTMKDFGITDDAYESICWDLILYLLSFEPGYLRFDYDIERQDGTKHPLNHLDIYYTSKNTFKIGLNEQLDNSMLIELLDINAECKFLK